MKFAYYSILILGILNVLMAIFVIASHLEMPMQRSQQYALGYFAIMGTLLVFSAIQIRRKIRRDMLKNTIDESDN